MQVHFVDTTFRDGSQSLWASGMRSGMMEAVAGDMDRAGFRVIEVPGNAIYFKKLVRDLKEDPWKLMARLATLMPNTTKACMASTLNLNLFGAPTPLVLGKLFFKRLYEMGALQRAQLMSNTQDQIARDFSDLFGAYREIGIEVVPGICYSLSPRHNVEHFRRKTREVAAWKPEVIYIKDAGGLLTVDRLREIAPAILEEAGTIPVELHSHCTTGEAPMVYAAALELGIPTLHTGIPPLAEGSAQPSVLRTARNAISAGHSVWLDLDLVQSVSDRLLAIARIDGMPVGAPSAYDAAQYVHQIPGGVISNLRHQLASIGLQDRLEEVIEETVRVRADMGYPVMITPHSQYVCTQAALNVQAGERYKVVLDELLLFARGRYGEDSGYQDMDEGLRDRLLENPRGKELAAKTDPTPQREMTLAEARALYGGANVSDEEMLLRAMMQGQTGDIEAMRAAGPWRHYAGADPVITRVIERFGSCKSLRHLEIRRGDDGLVLQRG